MKMFTTKEELFQHMCDYLRNCAFHELGRIEKRKALKLTGPEVGDTLVSVYGSLLINVLLTHAEDLSKEDRQHNMDKFSELFDGILLQIKTAYEEIDNVQQPN